MDHMCECMCKWHMHACMRCSNQAFSYPSSRRVRGGALSGHANLFDPTCSYINRSVQVSRPLEPGCWLAYNAERKALDLELYPYALAPFTSHLWAGIQGMQPSKIKCPLFSNLSFSLASLCSLPGTTWRGCFLGQGEN